MDTRALHPMEELKRKLAIVKERIPPGSQIVYLDYPVHENVGDLLIMLGTEAFFAENGIRVRGRYSCINYRSRMRIPPGWIIVCHGGGNFGDLYPRYQALRETVARRYPDHRIVVLPQTVYFQDPERQRHSLEALSRHKDLHLYVRDEVSYEAVKGHLANVYLSPDMAHQLYPIRAEGAGDRVLGLLRTDGEAAAADTAGYGLDRIADWPELLSRGEKLALRWLVRAFSLDRRLGNALPLRPLWYRYARRLVGKAVRLYADSGRIVTSRLHGHLLACLMNKPNVLLDNSYGKNGSYYRLWTRRLEHAASAVSPAAANGEEKGANELETWRDARDLYAQST
ncbi:polysaccharide pyruvyl transferase family protein [Cohnella nanjingensis]|uniref:Polysaccharide pyruvyl transferase family protein n=1 Tax=Cohnella nanjingensis TaxID=1387779 RepID=A0A7X0VFX2_9BACL|nr:polysaccharide pyruvyl transferase family protein [Cohnella nanjingensis]MBB6671723.1 polysaccharide pyruvyl transferase family protein [Cohnella nanjingensis]